MNWLAHMVRLALERWGYLALATGLRLLRWFRGKLHMGDELDVATNQIRHHGGATVFWTRYICGLRTIAGPVAGALGMEWKRFLLYNALGACTWVTAISLTGYLFANEFNSQLGYLEKGSWAISAGLFAIGYILWRREKKQFHERHHRKAA